MNLGETIYKRRTGKGMSQGDLADALNVSRQSISKWETNSSVPELDKIIKLSEIFDVSLDELILDKPQKESPEPQMIYMPSPSPCSNQKSAGIILLCFGALIWLVITLLGDILSGLVFASPFLFCGLICMFVRRHAGLWCCWTVYCLADLYMRFMTGINWRFTFRSLQFANELTIQAIVAWTQVICFIILTVLTVLRFRQSGSVDMRKTVLSAIATWTGYGLSFFLLRIADIAPAANAAPSFLYHFFFHIFDWIRNILFVVAIIFTVRTILQRIQQKQ